MVKNVSSKAPTKFMCSTNCQTELDHSLQQLQQLFCGTVIFQTKN